MIAGYLWSQGITRVDAIVLSHPDADHFNAVPGLLERTTVGGIFVSPIMFREKAGAVDALRDAIRQSGVPVRVIAAGDRLSVGEGCRIEVLHPPPGGVSGSDNANSVVLAIEYEGQRLLLTGDLESPGLDNLVAEEPWPCDVLLVPHHGSLRSNAPALAAWAAPKWAVVSAGHRADVSRTAAAYRDVRGRDSAHRRTRRDRLPVRCPRGDAVLVSAARGPAVESPLPVVPPHRHRRLVEDPQRGDLGSGDPHLAAIGVRANDPLFAAKVPVPNDRDVPEERDVRLGGRAFEDGAGEHDFVGGDAEERPLVGRPLVHRPNQVHAARGADGQRLRLPDAVRLAGHGGAPGAGRRRRFRGNRSHRWRRVPRAAGIRQERPGAALKETEAVTGPSCEPLRGSRTTVGQGRESYPAGRIQVKTKKKPAPLVLRRVAFPHFTRA